MHVSLGSICFEVNAFLKNDLFFKKYFVKEMGLSYTWYNSIRVTHFISHRFLRDLMVEKHY